MITELIFTQLEEISFDVSTVAIFLFAALIVIHFFVNIKPAIDSKRRVEKMANRRFERYQANNLYQSKVASTNPPISSNNCAKLTAPSKAQSSFVKSKSSSKRRSNNGYYKNDKGYQEYLRRNSNNFRNKQVIKHSRLNRVSKFFNSSKSNGLRSNQGRFGVKFIGDLPLNRMPDNPRYTGPTNSFKY